MSGYDDLFEAAGQKYDVDPRLLKTVFQIESGGNANAPDSYRGAQGGMQMQPATAAAMGASNPRDMTQAVPAAARYLAEGLDATGTPQGALAYYHGGPDRAQWGPKTAAYVAKGQSVYQTLGSQPVAQKQADDPDLAAGQAAFDAMTAGGSAPRGDAAKAADPDEAAGMAAFQSMTANAKAAAPAAEPSIDPITGFPVDATGKPTGQGTTLAGQDQGTLIPGNSASGVVASIPKTTDEARALLAEKPGYTASNILPIRVKNGADGQADPSQGVELDIGPLRAPLNALLDLAEGTKTGKVTPEATALLAQAAMGGGLMRSPAAGTGAAIAGATEAAAPKATVTEITPADLAAARNKLTAPAEPAARPNALTGDAPVAAPQAPANALTGAAAPSPQPGMGAAPTGAPVPKSVGAAASAADEAAMTPRETKAYQVTAEKEKLNEPQRSGEHDNNQYVPGVTPTNAEIEQTVNAAREQKAMGNMDAHVSDEAKEVAQQNNDARVEFLKDTIKSPIDKMNAEDAAHAQAEEDIQAAFGNKKATNAAPVEDTISQVLNNPRNSENTTLQKYVDPLLKRLRDGDGNLKTDPEQLYGLREDVNRMMSKPSQAADPNLSHISKQLGEIKDALDGAIEQGAPGYRQYLANYANNMQPVNEMNALQSLENGLYSGANRNLTYGSFQRAMKQIVEARQARGSNDFKGISDDTMQRLWALRDDLRRSASAQELARAQGSDTVPNMFDAMKQIAKNQAGRVVGHGVAALVGANPLVHGLVEMGVGVRQAAKANAEAARIRSRGMELLHPKTPLRNPLLEP